MNYYENKPDRESEAHEYRFGDFFRNFIAVVLGIVITFAGSDLIEERKIRNEVKDALSLVKDEILLNRETIEELMEQELFEQRGGVLSASI